MNGLFGVRKIAAGVLVLGALAGGLTSGHQAFGRTAVAHAAVVADQNDGEDTSPVTATTTVTSTDQQDQDQDQNCDEDNSQATTAVTSTTTSTTTTPAANQCGDEQEGSSANQGTASNGAVHDSQSGEGDESSAELSRETTNSVAPSTNDLAPASTPAEDQGPQNDQ